jgi:DNA-directed RNA polymerase subunit RPC12/RpoP
MIFTCAQCKQEFKRPNRANRTVRCCSMACLSKYRLKLKPEDLMPYARRGTRLKRISEATGVYYLTIARLMRQYGLYRQWAHNRYPKCAGVKQQATRLEANAAT